MAQQCRFEGRRELVAGSGRGIERAIAEHFAHEGAAEIVTARSGVIASIAGKKGSVGQSASNASKHAQIGLTRWLALEYGRGPVRVNAICPGFTATDLIDLAGIHDKSSAAVWPRRRSVVP